MKILNPKVYLLDGLGINAKTWICNLLNDHGIYTLTSNSRFYTQECRDLFPDTLKYTTRFEVRLHEIVSNTITLFDQDILVVDRSAFNQILFGKLNYDKVLVNYILNEDDNQVISKNILKYRELEDSFLPNVERILFSTENKKLIDNSLDWSLYEVEQHATSRIDAFEDYEHYCKIRDVYNEMYLKYCPDAKILTIKDVWDINDVAEFVNNVVCQIKSKNLQSQL